MLFGLAIMAGCQREKVEVYWTPKEQRPATRSQADAPEAPPALRWTTPAGWREEAPGQMQVANFTFGQSNQQANVSIIPLAGMDATDLQVANIYRASISLPPLDPSQLAAASVPVKIGSEEG